MRNQNTPTDLKIDYVKLRKSKLVLRALDHPLRKKIIRLLDGAKDKRMTVTELYVAMRLEQSVASQHLALLRGADVVSTQREGKFIYYSVDHTRLKEVDTLITDLVG